MANLYAAQKTGYTTSLSTKFNMEKILSGYFPTHGIKITKWLETSSNQEEPQASCICHSNFASVTVAYFCTQKQEHHF